MKRLFILILSLCSILAAQDLTGKKLYINAGHGGHDSNDRPPINDAGYWESEGNLTRALVVETLLKNMGATVVMSRRHNRISDGAALSSLGTDASNQNCDWFHSIHTNAAGGNSTLMLYSGVTDDPIINVTQQHFSGMLTFSNYMGNNIKAAVQTTHYTHAGDYTFYGSGHNYLGVFRYLTIPGTLSESSFHDYWPNTYRLQNLDNRINDGWAIALAFVQYYGEPLPDFGNLAGIVRTKEDKTNYEYITGTNDEYEPVDSLMITLNPGNRVYYGNTTMYVDKYTPQWSQITSGSPINPNNWAAIDNSSDSDYDYYTNGYDNNHNYNRNNGFYLFDSLAFGNYTVVFDAPGYWPDTTVIVINDSKFFWTLNRYMESSVPPFVKVATPENHEAIHPAWEPIILSFSHLMDTSLVKNGLTISPEVGLIYSWDVSLKKLTLTYVGDSLEVETDYTLTLDANTIIGNRGQHLDGNGDGVAGDDFVLEFTTSPKDIYAPAIISSYPRPYTTKIELNPVINIQFDEMIDTTYFTDKMIFMYSYPAFDTVPLVVQHNYINEQSVFNLFPMEELEPVTIYLAAIMGEIADYHGNSTVYNTKIRFTTGTESWNIKNIDTFESGLTSNWWSPEASGSTSGIDPSTARSENADNNYLLPGSTKSMELNYDWDLNASSWLIRVVYKGGSSTQDISFGPNSALQVYIFGDGSGNQFRFAIDEVGGSSTSEVSKWYTIDWIGWKVVTWYYDDPNSVGSWIGNGVLDGTSYRFDSIHLTHVSESSEAGIVYFDDLRVVSVEQVSSIRSNEPMPANFVLHQNYPNPFNPSTTITFSLPEISKVSLDIFNIRGQKIRNLLCGKYNSGNYSKMWDGKNDMGKQVPSGVYIYRLTTDQGNFTRDMLLMK